jgi:hypothetical protein
MQPGRPRSAPAGETARAIGRLVVSRQALITYLLVLAAYDALAIGLLSHVVAGAGVEDAAVAQRNGDDADHVLDALGSSPLDHLAWWGALLLVFAGGALLGGWLRSAYLLGLGARGARLRPPLRTMAWMTLFLLLTDLGFYGFAALGRVDGLALLQIAVLAGLTVFTLYADYAIALDGVSLVRGLVRSLEVVRALPRLTIVIFTLTFFASGTVSALFDPGEGLDATVQPFAFIAAVALLACVQFLTDCALVTVYGMAPSEAGSSDPAEEPSD